MTADERRRAWDELFATYDRAVAAFTLRGPTIEEQAKATKMVLEAMRRANRDALALDADAREDERRNPQ